MDVFFSSFLRIRDSGLGPDNDLVKPSVPDVDSILRMMNDHFLEALAQEHQVSFRFFPGLNGQLQNL